MLTVLLAAIAGYIALGIAVVLTINYALTNRESRLRSIGDALPLVVAWPVVLLVRWALNH